MDEGTQEMQLPAKTQHHSPVTGHARFLAKNMHAAIRTRQQPNAGNGKSLPGRSSAMPEMVSNSGPFN
jgi:hypothetical protein